MIGCFITIDKGKIGYVNTALSFVVVAASLTGVTVLTEGPLSIEAVIKILSFKGWRKG